MRLTIDGTGIATSILKERYLAGDSIDELAADYQCYRLGSPADMVISLAYSNNFRFAAI
jgi:hypothetical protein